MKASAKAKLSDTDITARLATLPGWQFTDNHLQRVYRTGGFRSSLIAANTIGHLAELAWHHPDLIVSYPSVTVKLQSHDVGGISERDFALARQIEVVLGWRPGRDPDGALEGTPADAKFVYLKD